LPENHCQTGPRALKAAWVVTAGLIPNEPMDELTRQWSLTNVEWESPAHVALFNAALVGALEYARYLMDPQRLNWTRIEWIWR
jgi:hypothetical protein